MGPTAHSYLMTHNEHEYRLDLDGRDPQTVAVYRPDLARHPQATAQVCDDGSGGIALTHIDNPAAVPADLCAAIESHLTKVIEDES